jgi:hypothetical protein
MQVTLTPHGEELLRSALARNPDQSPAEIVEFALAQRLEPNNPAAAPTDLVWESPQVHTRGEIADPLAPALQTSSSTQSGGRVAIAEAHSGAPVSVFYLDSGYQTRIQVHEFLQRYREKLAICTEEQADRAEDFRQTAAAVPLSRLEIDSEAWPIFERHRHLSGDLTLAEMDAEVHARANRELWLVQRSGNKRP